MFDQENS